MNSSTNKAFRIKLRGTAPLLLHRFTDDARLAGMLPKRAAEAVSYQNRDGIYCIPTSMIRAVLTEMAIVQGAYTVTPSVLTPLCDAFGKGITEFDVDSRPAMIEGQREIMRHRPRFHGWFVSFVLRTWDNISVPGLTTKLNEAGEKLGFGDYRPQSKGPFGTFVVEAIAMDD